MSENALVTVKKNLPAIPDKSDKLTTLAVVNYEKIDTDHYSFTFDFGDDVKFRMDESERTAETTDFIDIEFDSSVKESEKTYYSIAAASGILLGLLSTLHLSEEKLASINKFKEGDWKPIIISVAQVAGYKKTDYKGASKYLVDHAVRKAEKNSKVKEALTVLAEHPSIAGLVFSVLTQFAGKKIVVTDSGIIKKSKLPDYYIIGSNNAEKIVCAFLYWLFSLGMEKAECKFRILDEMKYIPNALRKVIKEFTGFSFFEKASTSYSRAEEAFSQWLSGLIKNAGLSDDEGEKKDNLYIAIIKVMLDLAGDSYPVLINECIVRSAYILLRLCSEVKERNISSFEQLEEIPVFSLIPTDGRVLSRMCLISSGAFVGGNIAGAALKALKERKAGDRNFKEVFLSEINFAGLGRFLFACVADSKYWGDDISILFQRKPEQQTEAYNDYCDYNYDKDNAFDFLLLDAIQTRILYSLESVSVKYDIAHTEKKENARLKQLWLDTWKETLLKGIDVAPELADKYFCEDEKLLYDGIFQLAQDKNNWGWFYLLTEELSLFVPYAPLGSPYDKAFKKLKLESQYVRDQFVRRQTIVSQDEVDKIIKTYSKYNGYVSGSTVNTIVGISVTAFVAAATGGLALTFAPAIAAAIAGEAVVGLHGAALTAASLAFVGGGSLAAGGLGVAGGTAIIAGGGALLGLVSSGTASAASVLLQTPSEYWVKQSSKLLTFCSCILKETLKDNKAITEISKKIKRVLDKAEKELDQIKLEKSELDAELIKKTEEYVKYLKKCHTELQRIIKKK